MLSAEANAIIRTQVAWRLDCALSDLGMSSPLVKAHGPRLADYHGVYVWQMDGAVIISTPTEWLQIVRDAVVGHASGALGGLTDPAFWYAALGERVDRIVGPSYQGYVDAETFRPAPTLPGPPARRLIAEDLPMLERFAATCLPKEWEHSAIHFDHDPIFALEREGKLVSAASAPDDGPGVASVGVITHPAWRGRGYGAAVVSELTADRLSAGAVLHYQTLRENVASVAIAHTLGYHDQATALGVRLRH